MSRFPKSAARAYLAALFFWLAFAGLAIPCDAAEIETRFGTIAYADRDVLRRFNRQLYMGRLSSEVKSGDTMEEDVKNKVELVAEKVMAVLDMYVPDLGFDVVIHKSPEGVQADFIRLYNRDVRYIAFYSPRKNTAYFSARHASLRVVAHEIGHVVAENFFEVSPPPRIHEVIAQYAENHVAK